MESGSNTRLSGASALFIHAVPYYDGLSKVNYSITATAILLQRDNHRYGPTDLYYY